MSMFLLVFVLVMAVVFVYCVYSAIINTDNDDIT